MMKLSNKAISAIVGVAVVAGTIGAAAAVSNGIVAQKAASSTAMSSTTVSSTMPSSAPAISSSAAVSSTASVSSKGTVSTVADGIDAIQKATDEGVNKIHEETSKAVSQIKEKVPVKHKFSASGKIKWPVEVPYLKGENNFLSLSPESCSVKNNSKIVMLEYWGSFPGYEEKLDTADGLKHIGFKLLDAKRNEIPFCGDSFLKIKVPYTNLSDVSTMYLVYKDQKITITIS
jgi:hypothetical protein